MRGACEWDNLMDADCRRVEITSLRENGERKMEKNVSGRPNAWEWEKTNCTHRMQQSSQVE